MACRPHILFLASVAVAAPGCLEFDDLSYLDGYCLDDDLGRYVPCRDAGRDVGPDADITDAELVDALDAGVEDGAPVDTGPSDSGQHEDAMPMDMGFADSGVHPDAMSMDLGSPDSGVHPDAMPLDAGPTDSGVHPDAMPTDAGFVDLTITVTKAQPRDQVAVQTHEGLALCGFLLPSPCVLSVPAFALQPLRAAPDSSTGTSVFSAWSGAASACGSNQNCSVFTSGNLSLGATFVPQ